MSRVNPLLRRLNCPLRRIQGLIKTILMMQIAFQRALKMQIYFIIERWFSIPKRLIIHSHDQSSLVIYAKRAKDKFDHSSS
jgi:hypothetical protein